MRVLAPSAAAAAVIANHLCGPMGSCRIGPDVELEVFLRSEYHKRCDAEVFTHMVIDRARSAKHGSRSGSLLTRRARPSARIHRSDQGRSRITFLSLAPSSRAWQ